MPKGKATYRTAKAVNFGRGERDEKGRQEVVVVKAGAEVVDLKEIGLNQEQADVLVLNGYLTKDGYSVVNGALVQDDPKATKAGGDE